MRDYATSALLVTLTLLTVPVGYAPFGYEWRAESPMPTARSHLSAVAAEGFIFVIGGFGVQPGALGTNERYDPTTDTWTSRSSIGGGGRADFGAATLNGKIYIAGGVDSAGTCLKSLEEYDPLTDMWTSRASMSVVRAGLSLVSADGFLFAIGGHCLDSSHSEPAMNLVERYYAGDNSWMNVTGMPVSLNRVYGVSVGTPTLGNRVYVIGGDQQTLDSYVPTTDTWTRLPGLNGTSLDVTVYSAATLSTDNSTIEMTSYVNSLTGGFSGNETIEYDTTNNHWVNRTANPFTSAYSALASVGGEVFSVGGSSAAPSLVPLNKNEAFLLPGAARPQTGLSAYFPLILGAILAGGLIIMLWMKRPRGLRKSHVSRRGPSRTMLSFKLSRPESSRRRSYRGANFQPMPEPGS